MDDKATKQEVRYSDHGTDREHCQICRYYVHGGACTKVAGRISPQGWCRKFKKSPHAGYGAGDLHPRRAA
jgi:hypothetical protein